MFYYKDELENPIESEYELNGLTSITKKEYNALVHKREVRIEINELKWQLKHTDYVVIKIAEAATTEEQASLRELYADVIANRIQIRARINELEEELQ